MLEERLVAGPPEADDLDLVAVLQVAGEVQHRARGAALAPAADRQDRHARRIGVVTRAGLRANVAHEQAADDSRDRPDRCRAQRTLAESLPLFCDSLQLAHRRAEV